MNPLTVTQVNTYIKALLDGSEPLRNIYITGEISNFKHYYSSGHMYFTLKDASSQLKAVMFSSYASRLKFEPENGMKVICRGRISVYEKNGDYQLYAEDMQPDGLGALSLAYEKLKEKLFKEGVCSDEIKKPLPPFPQRIGVVTSNIGAAVQDIKNITARRYPLAELVIVPTVVQGEKAAPDIVSSISLLDSLGDIDVIIVGRGGGSVEDLWAFNTEEVARAVIACKTPIVSAVGHESDFTICDYVADLRAPTPSAAAEIVCPDINTLYIHIRSLKYTAELYITSSIDAQLQNLSEITEHGVLADPNVMLSAHTDRIENFGKRLNTAFTQRAELEFHRFSGIAGKLNALSPLAVMSRGYAVARRNGRAVGSMDDLSAGDRLTVSFSDGEADCDVCEVRKYEKQ